MRHIELDASVLELEAAMRALVDAIYQSDTPEHMCVEYNGVMVFAGPDDVVRPSIVERLAWSWRMTRHQSWLFRPRPAVTDLVLEVEAMDGYLLRRLDAPNISDPSIGLRLLVDLAPTLYCPWAGSYADTIVAWLQQNEHYKRRKGESFGVKPTFATLEEEGYWQVRGVILALTSRALGYIDSGTVADLRDWLQRYKKYKDEKARDNR